MTEKAIFSPAFLVGDNSALAFLSGQVAIRPDGTVVDAADPTEQVRQVFDNLDAAVRAAGGVGLADLVRTTVYLVSTDLVGTFYAVRAALYPDAFADRPRPASTLVIVSALVDPRFLVEIDGVAAIR